MAKVEMEPGVANLVIGRNGTWKLTAFEIIAINEKRVYVSGYGKSGKEIVGGFAIQPQVAVETCKRFLEEQGYTVEPKY